MVATENKLSIIVCSKYRLGKGCKQEVRKCSICDIDQKHKTSHAFEMEMLEMNVDDNQSFGYPDISPIQTPCPCYLTNSGCMCK